MGEYPQAYSKSPTPIPVSAEPEGQPRLDRQQLQLELEERFRNNIADQTMQELTEVLDRVRRDQASSLSPEERGSEIVVLSPTTVGLGGGFHLDHPAHSQGWSQSDSHKSKVTRLTFKPPQLTSNAQPHHDDSEDSEIELERPIPAPRFSRPRSAPNPAPPSCPVADPASPFLDSTTLFLGYPPDDAPSPHGCRPNNTHADTSPTAPPSQAPGEMRHSQTHRERSSSRYDVISTTSSISLGDPIPSPPPPGQGTCRPAASQTQQSQRVQKTYTSKARRSAHAQSFSVARTRPPGTTSYATRLNITSIGSQRGPLSQTSGAGPSRRVRARARNITPWHAPSQQAPPIPRTSSRRPAQSTPYARAPRESSELPKIHPPAPADLLEDDKEERTAEKAAAEGSEKSSHYRKPTMNDLHGNEWDIVDKLKDQLWVFSLREGILQTRSTFQGWFDALFKAVWENDMGDKPFEPPSREAATVAINNIASRRGRVKDRVRSVIRYGCGFVDPTNDQERAKNIENYTLNWPNSFHLLRPRTNYGHYESELVTKSMTAAFFHSPTAIGVKYRNHFQDMRFTIVAFVLAMMQFCLGEWQDGHFTNTKLDANYLLSLYICHYEGLKEAQKKVPVRMLQLRKKWFKQSLKASGSQVVCQKFIQPITRQENIRPDTPPSSHMRSHPLSPQGFSAPGSPGPSCPLPPCRASSVDISFDTPPPPDYSPCAPPADDPLPEKNSEGRYTAHAKGKGRAID